MKIGDIVFETPYMTSEDGIAGEARGPQRCRVVYIHPSGRYYVCECTGPGGAVFRQSFYPPEREGNPLASMAISRGPGAPGEPKFLFRN